MKKIVALIGVLFVIVAWIAIYKAVTFFQFQWDLKNSAQKQVDAATNKANALVESGKQMISSGVDSIVASWNSLYEQKKKEAEAYLLQQKEQLKQEAQKRLEEEAKKKIEWVFNNR